MVALPLPLPHSSACARGCRPHRRHGSRIARGAPSEGASTPRLIQITRGSSYKGADLGQVQLEMGEMGGGNEGLEGQAESGSGNVAGRAAASALAPPPAPPPPHLLDLPVLTEAEERRLSFEERLAMVMSASAANAAAATAAAAAAAAADANRGAEAAAAKAAAAKAAAAPKETVGMVNQRRRRLLATATAQGVGTEARLVFQGSRSAQGSAGGAPATRDGAGGVGAAGSGDEENLCVVCHGSGKTSSFLTAEQAVAAGCRSVLSGDERFLCGVCFGDGEFCVSTTCRHFYCRDCIVGTLSTTVELGQFPLMCPTCKASPSPLPRNGQPVGLIDESALAFLLCRGAISRDLFFRIRKAAAVASLPPPSLAIPPSRGGGKAPMRLLQGREGSSASAYTSATATSQVEVSAASSGFNYSACPANCGHYLLASINQNP